MPNFYNNNIKYANPPAGGCNWDFDYYRTNYINATLLTQLKDASYIKSGLVPTIGTGLYINYTAGVAVINNNEMEIAAGTAAMQAAPIGSAEINVLYVSAAGVVTVTQEDPPDGAKFAALAIVDTDDTTIVRMIDARNMTKADQVIPEVIHPGKNKIINGNFDIWQRGTSQTTSGYGSADRWMNTHLGSTKTVTQQTFVLGQTEVPGYPKNFSRTVVSSIPGAGNYVLQRQRIERVDAIPEGKATLSFYAKADAVKNISVGVYQHFGTGGTPSSPVVTHIQKVALSASWQKITISIDFASLSGKTKGADGDNIDVYFWLEAGSNFDGSTDFLGQQSGTFDIAQVQLEAGSQATEFEQRLPGVELALCQRYYWQGGFGGHGAGYKYQIGGTVNVEAGTVSFPVTMRAIPTIATVVAPTETNCTLNTFWANNLDGFVARVTITATGQFRILSGVYSAEAEL